MLNSEKKSQNETQAQMQLKQTSESVNILQNTAVFSLDYCKYLISMI